MENSIKLKKGEGRTIKRGGLWIFDNEIAEENIKTENGDIADVYDFDGYFLGNGFVNTNSHIRVRMLTRRTRIGEDISLDELLRERVRAAWEYRKTVTDTSSCRLIFGEADFLPGLVVDKFEDVLVVESLALGIDKLKPKILEEIKIVLAQDGISIRGIYERSDAKVRLEEGLERYKGFIGRRRSGHGRVVRAGQYREGQAVVRGGRADAVGRAFGQAERGKKKQAAHIAQRTAARAPDAAGRPAPFDRRVGDVRRVSDDGAARGRVGVADAAV